MVNGESIGPIRRYSPTSSIFEAVAQLVAGWATLHFEAALATIAQRRKMDSARQAVS